LRRQQTWLPTIAEARERRLEYAKAVARFRDIAARKRAIIVDPLASDSDKTAARSSLDNCGSLEPLK
jgi:hypothetical protein